MAEKEYATNWLCKCGAQIACSGPRDKETVTKHHISICTIGTPALQASSKIIEIPIDQNQDTVIDRMLTKIKQAMDSKDILYKEYESKRKRQ